MSGHFGRDKTVALKVYFPGLRQKIIDYIKSCVPYQCMKCGGRFEKGGEKLKYIQVPRMPGRQLGIDCVTNLPPTDEGYDTIVTAIDYTSKWPESVLYPNPDEGDTLLGCTLINDPSCTPSSCDDDAFLPDLAETNPATPDPVHTDRTLSAAEILADLSEGGGGVSGHNESAGSLQLQLEVSTNGEQQTQEVDVENTQYEDQTMETIDPDLIVNGV